MAKLKHKKLIITLSVIFGVIAALVAAFFIYVGIYYRASGAAKRIARTDTPAYTVSKKGDNIVFLPSDPIAGLIFYPGGKVEYEAYAPLMAEFANRGVACVLVKMPFNLAVFDSDAADGIKSTLPGISSWYMGGHSLGGAMAAKYIADHTKAFEGLILLGAYSTENISKSGLRVYSVYGSEDKVLDRKKYGKYRKNLPSDAAELVIAGGCHAYFGDYGAQSGDGKPKITRKEQMEQTVEFILNGEAINY